MTKEQREEIEVSAIIFAKHYVKENFGDLDDGSSIMNIYTDGFIKCADLLIQSSVRKTFQEQLDEYHEKLRKNMP